MDEQRVTSLQARLARERARLTEIDVKRESILRRIRKLQAALSPAGRASAPTDAPPTCTPQTRPLTSSEKVTLFRDLFQGRLDVYPTRWVNAKKGTKGYSPACSNEWVRGVCEKPRVKCGECPNQAFVPFTDQTIRDHFRGRLVAGVYPLLNDDRCWFLAADFDKGAWRDDVAALVETCAAMNVPVAVERSRSGDGAHAWFFFDAPVAAVTARQMGCYLLTKTMARRHELSMASYDRLFPNQDTLPRGGFGNLIALPFQDGPRQRGNTVFVDATWTPHPDQWAFLASVRRMTPSEVEALAREAANNGEVIGFHDDDGVDEVEDSERNLPLERPRPRVEALDVERLPRVLRAVLAQRLFVQTDGLPSALIDQIKRLAAFPNPEFYKKQALRLSTALTPRVISCAEARPDRIELPRGCADDLEALLADLGMRLEVEDQRVIGDALECRFQGQLTGVQQQAVDSLALHDIGVFVAPPGSGKTVVGANMVARRARSTLVLVHRTQLLEQWIAQLSVFLDLEPREIGQIGGGKRKPNGLLDVAMIQSLTRSDQLAAKVAGYGQVIVDECHHVPAVSFERVMRDARARYLLGLTATPRRRDGHHPILHLQLGPVRFTVSPRSQAARRPFNHRLIVRDTTFRLPSDAANAGIQGIYRRLTTDDHRNSLILDDVISALEEGRSPLLLTERRDHLHYFAERLQGLTRNLVILQGGMKARDRRASIRQLATIPAAEERLVLATGRFIGEGFDDARLDTLFLTMPVSWKGTLVQYAGRLHRKCQAKVEVRIIDYRDRNVPMLERMFDKRMKGYRAMGYRLVDPPNPEGIVKDRVIEYDEEALRQPDVDA